MCELTPFQIRCHGEVVATLRQLEVEFFDKQVFGKRDTHILLTIPENKIKIWIYNDEPELIIGDKSYIFEVPDYPDERLRISIFIDAVIATVKGEAPDDKGTARVIFFKGNKL